ncbi:MAG: hypothetical protein L0214_10140 [candidate division NC10 bacterium]|nr:hypothetical protein [candidate division NC10 bacterium]
MVPNVESALSPELRLVYQILTLPVSWIPKVQTVIFRFFWDFSSPLMTTLKFTLLLLPAFLVIVGMWCTMCAVYTLPFRGARGHFIVAMLTNWWDSGRAVTFFWAGMVRALFLSVGWIWGLLRILAGGLYLAVFELFMLPFSLIRRATQNSLQPGLPWLAVILTLFWSLLEAGIFSYTLYPTASEIASDLVGSAAHALLQPVLFVVLFLLIAGSFACLQVMVEAMQQHNWKDIIQMVLVELFVMFVEVVFLYRELVDAITPWLAQQSGGQLRMGVTGVLLISTLAWIGVRGMTWFLFGRFGTPTLLAIISRRGGAEIPAGARPTAEAVFVWTKEMIGHVKKEIGWFHTTGKELVEAYALPPLQVVATTINFFMVFFTGRHLFNLPLKTLHALTETVEVLKLPPGAHGSHASRGADSR